MRLVGALLKMHGQAEINKTRLFSVKAEKEMTSLVAQATHTLQSVEFFSREQIELVKSTICRGATDDELRLFLGTCERLRLDPFAKQVHSVPRKNKKTGTLERTTQVSIDGFRLIAERTGKYQGQTPVEWCGKDGKWSDVWLHNHPPAAARVGVLREGFMAPLFAVATLASYGQYYDGNLSGQWKTMPDVMIAKCAEALALRKAFPNDLSGVYTPDEMGQAENEVTVRTVSQSSNREAAMKAIVNYQPLAAIPERTEEQDLALKSQASRMIGSSASLDDLIDAGVWIKSSGLSGQKLSDVRKAYADKKLWLESQKNVENDDQIDPDIENDEERLDLSSEDHLKSIVAE